MSLHPSLDPKMLIEDEPSLRRRGPHSHDHDPGRTMNMHTHGSDDTAASGMLPPPDPDPVPRALPFAGRMGGE